MNLPDPVPVTIPLLNPNEPEAVLAALYVEEGEQVTAGGLLCSLETTKTAGDVSAPAAGYVAGLTAGVGETVRAGDVLCYLASEPGWQPPAAPAPAPAAEGETPSGLRITQPALALARQRGLDLARLPLGPLVTESLVRSLLEQPAAEFSPPPAAFDPTAILVYGGGGHGKALIDLLRALGSYHIVGVVDDGLKPAGHPAIMGVPLLGGAEVLPELYARGVRLAVNAVGGIGNIGVRIKIFTRLLEAGFGCPAVVHPRAFVEPSAVLSPGVQVFPHAYVGSEAQVGFGAIVNTGAILSHDCRLDEYVNISPGAILAGEVQVGRAALVGMGATLNLQVKVGPAARIGNGATVKSDVPARGVVRAGAVWPE